jgi:hypothetical protein
VNLCVSFWFLCFFVSFFPHKHLHISEKKENSFHNQLSANTEEGGGAERGGAEGGRGRERRGICHKERIEEEEEEQRGGGGEIIVTTALPHWACLHGPSFRQTGTLRADSCAKSDPINKKRRKKTATKNKKTKTKQQQQTNQDETKGEPAHKSLLLLVCQFIQTRLKREGINNHTKH